MGLNGDPIPPHVRSLLRHRLTSVSEVEILVLLVTDPRHRALGELAAEVGLEREHLALILASLLAAGLVALDDDDRYGFAGDGSVACRAAEDLARLYGTYRVRVMHCLLGGPASRLAGALRHRAFGE